MAITSEEIQNQIFTINRKGYDRDEVDVFLEHVADEIDGLNAEIRRLTEQVRSMRDADAGSIDDEAPIDLDAAFAEPAIVAEPDAEPAPAAPLTEDEKDARIAELESKLAAKSSDASVIAEALLTAQRSAKEVTDKAEADSRKIHKDAEADAADIIERANVERAKIETAISDLELSHKATCESYAESLRAFIDDANKKLADINEELTRKKPVRTQMHYASAAAAPAPTGAVAASSVIPGAHAKPAARNAAPGATQVVERDLSGYGDASDAFDLGDLD